MNKSISFSAGPAALPYPVLETIQRDLMDWQGTGVSVLETGHRTQAFSELGEKLEASVRRILQVPEDFAVLFLPGGGQVQFAMAVMNLARGFTHANYVETGHWSSLALQEAKQYLNVHVAASNREQQFTTIPEFKNWDIRKDAAFLHYTDNETIHGVEFAQIPAVDDMVLVSDMSSNIFSRPIDFSRIGCVYACAQKNFGVAGMSLVIVRRDLFDRSLPQTPSVLNYAVQDKNKSLACTPTTFAWYVASLVLDWLEAQGGLSAMAAMNSHKSQLLYQCIDANPMYQNHVDPLYRSRMNVTFSFTNNQLEKSFFQKARERGFVYLEGHRLAGGARASIYNAIGVEEVRLLADFMHEFASTAGLTQVDSALAI